MTLLDRPTLIAEVKIRSPFGYVSKHSWNTQFALAKRYGDMVSIHTHPDFGGSYTDIHRACSSPGESITILAKGYHKSDEEIKTALAFGANYVLVVGRVPGVHRDKCFIEPNSLAQLASFNLNPSEDKVVWNQRDLTTGKPKKETFEQAREIWKGWICQASLIKTKDDVKRGADAILVGEHLPEFIRSL